MPSDPPVQDDDCPVRSDAVTAYPVGDDAVLHDRLRDQVVAINTLTHVIWNWCDGTTPVAAIGERLARQYDVARDQAIGRVRATVRDLCQQKLLHANPGATEAQVTKLHVTFGQHQVALRTDAPEVDRALRRVFGPMLGAGDAATVDTLGAYAIGEHYHVRGSRVVHVDRGSLHEAVRSLKHEVVHRLIEVRPDLVWLHAGSVARDGAAILFVGAWGSGKSTLVATLYQAGGLYLSDDMVPYDPLAQRVTAFPLTIAYREHEGAPVDADSVPGLPKTYVDLALHRIQRDPVPVRAIVFPTFQPDVPAEVQPCAPAEAAVALVRQCQNGAKHEVDAVAALCALAGCVPTYRLQYNADTALLRLLNTLRESTQEP